MVNHEISTASASASAPPPTRGPEDVIDGVLLVLWYCFGARHAWAGVILRHDGDARAEEEQELQAVTSSGQAQV